MFVGTEKFSFSYTCTVVLMSSPTREPGFFFGETAAVCVAPGIHPLNCLEMTVFASTLA